MSFSRWHNPDWDQTVAAGLQYKSANVSTQFSGAVTYELLNPEIIQFGLYWEAQRVTAQNIFSHGVDVQISPGI